MRKRSIELREAPIWGEEEVVVEIPHALSSTFALELSLLVCEEAESLRLSAPDGSYLVLTLCEGESVGTAQVDRAPKGASFALGKNQAGYLQAVLLRAYRDGCAEVNHVHVEGVAGKAPFDLTLMFEYFAEPMSAEEMAKRTES